MGASGVLASDAERNLSPAALQAEINALNVKLDDCLLANGAERVPIEPQGWTYRDPGLDATRACSSVNVEMDAFFSNTAVRNAMSTPAFQAFTGLHAADIRSRRCGSAKRRLRP